MTVNAYVSLSRQTNFRLLTVFAFDLVLVGGSHLTRETVGEQFPVQRVARTITRSFAHEVIAAKFLYLDSEGEFDRLRRMSREVSV